MSALLINTLRESFKHELNLFTGISMLFSASMPLLRMAVATAIEMPPRHHR